MPARADGATVPSDARKSAPALRIRWEAGRPDGAGPPEVGVVGSPTRKNPGALAGAGRRRPGLSAR
ncbi:hypothetical protein GCM10028796_16040 [Ramlibacter monticola]